jgi:predicted nucleic acid-binding protein
LNAYPDASFLVALYVRQRNADAANAHVATMQEPLHVGSLLRFEVCNAIRAAAFRGEMPGGAATAALAAFDADVDAGVVVIPPVEWEAVHAEAERLSNAHTPRHGYRALDVLHVATALTAGAKTFLSFDKNLRQLAAAEGLKVKP